MDYSKTVNLLQTSFPMKADLPAREPDMLRSWDEMRLYHRIQDAGANRPVFLLHDGPPYANGDIHMGHALNKILKDIVVKYKTAAGFRAPYKPGWDCHGLPIEHQLFKKLGKSKHDVPRAEVRQRAAEYAMEFVSRQRADFIRLGVFAEWENPYLTLTNDYEASIVEALYELKEKNYIYRGLKPGYWCAYDETALAEAEVEYMDKSSDAVFVRFEVNGATLPSALKAALPAGKGYVAIWTTTPWTLPANTGLAFHPTERYTTLRKDGAYVIVADKLKEKVAALIGADVAPDALTFQGEQAVGMTAMNPLLRSVAGAPNRETRAVMADFVTMEDGTGIVHIAPGHGAEDFHVGQKFGLATISPVDANGRFDASVGRDDLIGKHVLKDANKAVMEALGPDLLHHLSFRHLYPHCWRCKNPIIFRATEQWFLSVTDAFRGTLLSQIDAVRWEPAYGIHRIKGMVETRPDWCLSRQRVWGAPIAMFFCEDCGELVWNKVVNERIVALIREKGANAYYETPVEDLLRTEKGVAPCTKCGGGRFRKEQDILDVWFDSGVSWHAVVEKTFSSPAPAAVMYLEGSDQHRGWFQTSLIPSVALRGRAPYDTVLTHGFVVDGKGHKMSKSLGNVIAPQEVIQKFGADVLRLWVALSDYREDVRLSQDIIKHMADVYRRFRNTFRFLLQNTADYRAADHAVALDRLEPVDRWILSHFDEVRSRVIDAYERYEFHVVLSEINRFVSVSLSGFYLDALKDRLYCETPDSTLRRSAQTALAALLRNLAVLLAPFISFTAEEAYREHRSVSDGRLPESVFLDSIADLPRVAADATLNQSWARILEVRSAVNDELDRQRKAGVVRSQQEASVVLNRPALPEDVRAALDAPVDWAFLLQMADSSIINDPGGPAVRITATTFAKCERCWRHRTDVGEHSAHPTLCGRCAAALAPTPA